MDAVIFDFNGTLFNDTDFHRTAWQRYMKERFGRDCGMEEINEHFIGPSNSAIFRYCFGDEATPENIERWSEEKETYYRAAVCEREENKRLRPGEVELLDLLTERGVPIAMATASPLSNVEFYLNELGMDRWFDMSRIVYEDGSVPSKPHPGFYTEAARRIDRVPGDCVVMEDSVTGIQAAVNAGAGRIVAIAGTTDSAKLEAFGEQLYAVIPDFCGAERYID